MSNEIVVSSTSDSDEQVREAAGLPKQLSLEDGEHGEESQLQRERSENGNGQREHSPKLQRRINRLTTQKYAAEGRARAAERRAQELEARLNQPANGNVVRPHVELNESARTEQESQPEQRSESEQPEDHRVSSAREQYSDWDLQMSKAAKDGTEYSIGDEAARLAKSLPNAQHIVYMLVSNDSLRRELKKLPEAQQVAEIRRMNQHFEAIHSGEAELSQRIQKGLSKEELAELRQIAKENPGAGIPRSVNRALLALDNPAPVIKYLARNPEESARLASMSQERAMVEVGTIQARLEGNGHARLPVSQAPPPIRNLSGHGTPTVTSGDYENMDQATYKRLRDEGKIGMSTRERRARGMQ